MVDKSGPFSGMSLRDWFAAQALVGIIGDEKFLVGIGREAKHAGMDRVAGVASAAYEFADAMLKERER